MGTRNGKNAGLGEGGGMEGPCLGDTGRDVVTGFTGLVVGKTDFLFRTGQLLLQPQRTDEGEPADSYWFDEPRVEKAEKK